MPVDLGPLSMIGTRLLGLVVGIFEIQKVCLEKRKAVLESICCITQ